MTVCDMKEITVRDAVEADVSRIAEMRALQDRPVGGVPMQPMLPALTWLIAECDGKVVAAAGGNFAFTQDRTAIVTDFYDDGTLIGKRGLVEILADAEKADVTLYAIIPSDRPELCKHLARRGFTVTGLEMRRTRDAV